MELQEEAQKRSTEFGYVKGMVPTRYAKTKEDLRNGFLKEQKNIQKQPQMIIIYKKIIGDKEKYSKKEH